MADYYYRMKNKIYVGGRNAVLNKGIEAMEGKAVVKLTALESELLAALGLLLQRAQALNQSATAEGLTNCDALAKARAAIAQATAQR